MKHDPLANFKALCVVGLIFWVLIALFGCSNPVAPEAHEETIVVQLVPVVPEPYARITFLQEHKGAECQRTGSYQGWVRVGFDWHLDEQRETWRCVWVQ